MGHDTRVKVVKNKMAPPFKKAEFEIRYGAGISRVNELLSLGAEQGLIKKSGAWYSYDGARIGQGKENAGAWLQDNPEQAAQLEAALRAALFPPRPEAEAEAEPAAAAAEDHAAAAG